MRDQRYQTTLPHSPIPSPQSLIFLLLLAVSCRTAPELPPLNMAGIPLEPGGLAYVLVDTNTAVPILEHITVKGLDKKNFNQMIDKTNYVAAAVFPKGGERRLQLAAWGNYPASGAKTALGLNREWKKFRSPVAKMDYWHSSTTGASVSVNRGYALVSTSENNTVIDPYIAEGVQAPEGFGEFVAGSAVSCWLENPGPVINQKLSEMGIPVEIPAEMLFISLFPVDGQANKDLYDAHLRIRFSSAAHARGLATMISFMRNFSTPDENEDKATGTALLTALLFANEPVQNDNYLDIKTRLSGREISLLFGVFSL